MQKRWCGNSQSGRSMVEVLGVLAITGVLAIVGIVGYQYAMHVYRVAETYDEVSVTVSGARTWPILDHYGALTKIGIETLAPSPHADTSAYIVPIREVVSKVNYRNAITAAEAIELGVANKEYLDDSVSSSEEAQSSYYAKREYESFSSRTYAPVWVRAETPEAWSVRITGLSYDMCSSIVSKRELGYQYAYMALNAAGDPLDPSYWDFPLINESERYSNKDMAVHENVKKLCEGIDSLHRSVAPAYTFQKNIDSLNKEGSNIKAVGGCDVVDGVPSVRCMAFNARVDDLPLQTLVLYWGEVADGDIDFDKCIPGTCRNIDEEPTEYCCETEAGGLWIGNGICCALGDELDSAMTVQIGTKYYSLTHELTGYDTDGNRVVACELPPPPDKSCCIAGTAWFVGAVPTKGSGTCSGSCPVGPEDAVVPDQVESQWCCNTQVGGSWKLKPGNPSNMIVPIASNPKSSDRTNGGALCCWEGGDVLTFNNANPMSCDAPNIWSATTPVTARGVQVKRLNSSPETCPTASSGSSGSSGSSTGSEGSGSDDLSSDTNDGDIPGGGTGGGDEPGNLNNDECTVPQVAPPLDIYGQRNLDCCPTVKKNGFYQVSPYKSISTGKNFASKEQVSEECCNAMNRPELLLNPNDAMHSRYGIRYAKGTGNFCDAECCDVGYIEYAADNFKMNETNATFKSNIFLTAKGVSNPKICCQVLDGRFGGSAKANHPDCCETDLAYDVTDKVEKWVDNQTTIMYTELDTESNTCVRKMRSNPQGVCCKKGENGFDVECNENIFCCGDDEEENKKSKTCCPLVPNHIWDDNLNACVPCGTTPGDVGCNTEYCTEVSEKCCIKDINGCFEPYAWNPQTGGVELAEECCRECIENPNTCGPFIGFTKAAKDKQDKILGNCYSGFFMRSSSGN